MSMKHTPGPWVAFGREVYAAKGLRVSEDSSEANARLIAAAPDLLEAAKQVAAWYEAEDNHSKADFYERIEMCRKSEAAIRAAIAKAEAA